PAGTVACTGTQAARTDRLARALRDLWSELRGRGARSPHTATGIGVDAPRRAAHRLHQTETSQTPCRTDRCFRVRRWREWWQTSTPPIHRLLCETARRQPIA